MHSHGMRDLTNIEYTVSVINFKHFIPFIFFPLILLFMQLYFKILSRIPNSVDSDQTIPLGLKGLHFCTCHFVRKFSV